MVKWGQADKVLLAFAKLSLHLFLQLLQQSFVFTLRLVEVIPFFVSESTEWCYLFHIVNLRNHWYNWLCVIYIPYEDVKYYIVYFICFESFHFCFQALLSSSKSHSLHVNTLCSSSWLNVCSKIMLPDRFPSSFLSASQEKGGAL